MIIFDTYVYTPIKGILYFIDRMAFVYRTLLLYFIIIILMNNSLNFVRFIFLFIFLFGLKVPKFLYFIYNKLIIIMVFHNIVYVEQRDILIIIRSLFFIFH